MAMAVPGHGNLGGLWGVLSLLTLGGVGGVDRIHTIESTLQRLYGKLEADHELPVRFRVLRLLLLNSSVYFRGCLVACI
eukprot:543847-Rhodomonas_salina.1